MIVCDAILSAFFQVLFQRLSSRPFLDFFRRRELNQRILERLNITLLTINAVLADAEEKQITNGAEKKWVNELKDAVYNAEDVLDDIATEALRSNVEAESSSSKLRQLRDKMSSFDFPNRNCEDLDSNLEKVTMRLECLAAQSNVLGLKEITGTKPESKLPTTSLVDESEVFGRDGEKKEIMEFLLPNNENEKDISVVGIVGVGGVGKTTLAQLLYNDLRVQRHFSTRVWAYVSEEFDVFKITKTIYESVTSRPCDFTDLNLLQVRLKERLTGEQFLLILDDLWSEKFVDWDLLRRPFKSAAGGSRIIVTTRSQRVISIMRALHTHTLRPLSDGDCWLVFTKLAFEDQEPCLDRKFGGYAEKIVKKCQGLPLAARNLGGLLRFESEAEEWERILNSRIWELPADKSSILPVLRVSYYFLPAHLKQCFAYCSIFPKGYAFEKEKVVLLWMAEGFLQQTKGGKRLEELGDEYFSELVSRSLFQRKNESKFTMHDLVNDLSQYAAGEFCFKFEGSGEHQGISEKTRHLSYLRDQYGDPMKFEALREVKFLRTFLPLSLTNSSRSCSLDKMFSDKLLPTLSCLRVLCLSTYKITTLTPDFSNLRHVRYLDLSRTELEKLPKSVCCQYNLQTLILSYCPNLIELPADMCKLINLRYLDLIGTKINEMPRNFRRLKSLQTLTTLIVTAGRGANICELGNLLELHGKLSILELHRVVDINEAAGSDLKSKKHLKEIAFLWRRRAHILEKNTNAHRMENEAEVFEQLRPHQNIERITIEKYNGRRFPDWLGDSSFSNIVFLRLSDCQICTSLPSLGQLSGLKELHIANMRGLRRIGPEFYFTRFSSGEQEQQPFKSLNTLRLEDMPDWEDWWYMRASHAVILPSLQRLYLKKCPRLTGNLPISLLSLISLHIHECGDLDFLPDQYEYTYKALQRLSIRSSCDSLITFPLGFFSSLEDLEIHNCASLHSFQVSNEHLGGLVALRRLIISGCQNLESLPERGFSPQNLTEFSVSDCRNLRQPPEHSRTLQPSFPRLNMSDSQRF